MRANDIYIAQAAAGANNGQNCSGAYASTFFNSASNWGSGAAKIGPGTTVHVCGSWSGTAGVTYLTFHGSGIAGNPITLLFETGANMRQPYCGSSGGGCINVNNQGYITIDGGLNTPCGASNGGGAAANTCNGYIQNTLNGTSGGVCPGGTCQYQASSYYIYGPSSTDLEVRNLGFYDIYDRTSVSDPDPTGQSDLVAIYIGSATSPYIHDNYMHDGGWFIPGWSQGLTVINNHFERFDHALAFGIANTNVTTPVVIHDNHFGSMNNWDGPGCPGHHDGVHLWAQQDGSTGAGTGGTYFYNNYSDGDQGDSTYGCFNAIVYDEQGISNVVAYNNVVVLGSNVSSAGVLTLANKTPSVVSGKFAYNNTIIVSGTVGRNGGSGALLFTNVTSGTVASINNVLQGGTNTITIGQGGATATPCASRPQGSTVPGCVLTNAYENLYADGAGGNEFGFAGTNTGSLSTWQAGASYLAGNFGADANAQMLTLASFGLSSIGVPQSGSPMLQAGTNLTSLCSINQYMVALCSDINGKARPATGAWDLGAYYASGTSQTGLPAAPTKLTALVN